jgi:hypothetical protein
MKRLPIIIYDFVDLLSSAKPRYFISKNTAKKVIYSGEKSLKT